MALSSQMQEVLEAKEREVQQLTEGQREVSDRPPRGPVAEDSQTQTLGWLGSLLRVAPWERGVLGLFRR